MTLEMPSLFRVSWEVPWNSAGYSMAPTPTIRPCPGISRGTEWTVPMPPGLVREAVTPVKSSIVSLPERARRTMSSYACQNSKKLSVSAFLIAATTSCRSPLGLTRSMARPRLMCSGLTRVGLPSFSVNEWFIEGIAFSACTMA
ncbi:hypothetical protein SANTM175S_03011 [Streptomyces antimycoticus]